MAERHYYQREGFSALICSLCFRQNPQDEELTGVYCKAPRWHHGAPTVLVTWSTDWDALVEIRPLPQKAARRFVMCPHSPNCMHYPDCTFAHSKEEETVWNTQNKRRIQQTTSGPVSALYNGSISQYGYMYKLHRLTFTVGANLTLSVQAGGKSITKTDVGRKRKK